MVIVVDAPERENEGDLVMAAQHVSAEAVNFMATHARGLVCAPMPRRRLDELCIPPMVQRNTDPKGTAFHVGVDARAGVTTGISASDRATTIRALAGAASVAGDFTHPGHVFPLAAREGGVLARGGHTEAAIDLTTMAGLAPVAVICEIAREDGEMARMPDLLRFAARHGLQIVSIVELVAARRRADRSVRRTGEAALPLRQGRFTAIGYEGADGRDHMALVLGNVRECEAAIVRVHSECLTGDVFGSLRCDCGAQLEAALDAIRQSGTGAVVYLRGHEGRGIGLGEKLQAYRLQDQGLDTVEANLRLGHPIDARDYGIAAEILDDLGVGAVRLLTNNPAKRAGLERHGVRVAAQLPLLTQPTPENAFYLDTKRRRMGHGLAGAASA